MQNWGKWEWWLQFILICSSQFSGSCNLMLTYHLIVWIRLILWRPILLSEPMSVKPRAYILEKESLRILFWWNFKNGWNCIGWGLGIRNGKIHQMAHECFTLHPAPQLKVHTAVGTLNVIKYTSPGSGDSKKRSQNVERSCSMRSG